MTFDPAGLWETATHVFNLGLAFALALPVGWDRERDDRSAGIRTFPLVAIASCGFVLIGIAVLGRESMGQARIMEGLITGVGFIGRRRHPEAGRPGHRHGDGGQSVGDGRLGRRSRVRSLRHRGPAQPHHVPHSAVRATHETGCAGAGEARGGTRCVQRLAGPSDSASFWLLPAALGATIIRAPAAQPPTRCPPGAPAKLGFAPSTS